VRQVIRGIVAVESVVQTAGIAWRAEEEVRWRVGSRECNLRIFDRSTEPELVVEVLGNTETVLARPTEADCVLWVNRHRQRFCSIVQALPGFRHQAPHLTAGDIPSALRGNLSPQLPLAIRIA